MGVHDAGTWSRRRDTPDAPSQGAAQRVEARKRSEIGHDPVNIAPQADAGITAYHAAKKAVGKLNPGEHAGVIGVGGLGHSGVQCLDAMSAATVTAVDLKESALDLVEGLGVDHTVNPGNTDVREFVDGVTDGTGAEQVLDFVGADVTTEYAPDITAAGGDHHTIGSGGHVHEPAQALVNGEFSLGGGYRWPLRGTPGTHRAG